MLDAKTIGAMVRFHRKAAKLSRVELAELAGVGKTLIYEIENGKATLRLNTLALVLQALNIRAEWRSPLMGAFEGSRPQAPQEDGGGDA